MRDGEAAVSARPDVGKLDPLELRRVLGHYPTGVCAITAMDDGEPVGMIVGSFGSASLDPPLVAFFPDRKSTSWPRIARAERFCVNVLAAHQHGVCRTLATRGADKFAAIAYRKSQRGAPVIEGAVAAIDCDLHAVHDAGDHHVVLGIVRALHVEAASSPMLFLRGGYGRFEPWNDDRER